MVAKQSVVKAEKKAYVKPQLATHGSVQQLTEGSHRHHASGHDSGSNIRIPSDWKWDW